MKAICINKREDLAAIMDGRLSLKACTYNCTYRGPIVLVLPRGGEPLGCFARGTTIGIAQMVDCRACSEAEVKSLGGSLMATPWVIVFADAKPCEQRSVPAEYGVFNLPDEDIPTAPPPAVEAPPAPTPAADAAWSSLKSALVGETAAKPKTRKKQVAETGGLFG